MLEGNLDLNKVVTYALIILLGGSDVWQYVDFEDKIHRDTKEHSEVIYDNRVDSLIKVLSGKEFARGMMAEGAMEFKDLPKEEARKYMMKVFEVADEAIKNDSTWRNIQKPFIDYLEKNRKHLDHLIKYQYLVPMKDRISNELYFNWVDDVYPITEKRVTGGIIRRWRDRDDDQHSLVSISNIKDGI